MLKRVIIISFLYFMSNPLMSQNYMAVKGVVIDKSTNKPISYACISICDKSIGVISNENGEFIFKIPLSLADQNLCVSGLGYNMYSDKVSNFTENNYYTIKLEFKSYSLNELKVKGKKKHLSATKIVQQALEKIEDNNPISPFTLQGYYREYLKQGDKKYLNMLEAAVVIKDLGFKTSSFPYRAYILQMRYNKDYETDKDFQSSYTSKLKLDKNENIKYMPEHSMPILGGNELSILFAHDAIRRYNEATYSYVNQLNKDFRSNHSFTLDSISYQEDVPVYCISFEYYNNTIYKNNSPVLKSDIKGRMLISSNTYAIKRLEYVSYSIENAGMKNFEIIADYKYNNGKMYLNYLSFSNYFKQAISAKNALYQIPIEKQPLEIKDITVDNNRLILRFNKKVNPITAFNKKNYEFNGYLTKNKEPLTNSDTLLLSKYPDKVSVEGSTIRISLSNLNYLLQDDGSGIVNTNVQKSANGYILNSEVPAIIEGNVIKCKNLSLTINGIEDIYGNRFNSLCTLEMNQFREFFVNEILDNKYSAPSDAKMINNGLPLYLQMPKNIIDFWEYFNYPITTPLQDNYESISK